VNFANPTAAQSSGTFGSITSTLAPFSGTTGPRIGQLAVKIIF